jgi:1-deoxy-D-xylulose-5-phosphate reductoisomerase
LRAEAMKRVVILGSTGSIGRNALDVISRHRDRFSVVGLAAGRNIDVLEKQIREFSPEIAAVADVSAAGELRRRVRGRCRILEGKDGLASAAEYKDSDFVLSALVGFSGLIPTVHAVRSGKVIGLANKETLVIAGEIVMREARDHGAVMVPVDSEHSAIFQCLEGRKRDHVKRVILTASGGPFKGKKMEELKDVSLQDALQHPNWKMGRKVTIDSATMMNKGLEVIETSHFFGLGPERIGVLIHPESIIHSMVEFTDGSVLAQMAVPDMRGPIGYALSYPERLDNTVSPLELDVIQKLTFYTPDEINFPCLRYAYEALNESGTMPAVMNAANEVAVNAFIENRISFTEIPLVIRETMQSHNKRHAPDLDAVIEADRWAREFAGSCVGKCGTRKGR